MRSLALAALLSAGIGPALALSVPPAGASDPHIRRVATIRWTGLSWSARSAARQRSPSQRTNALAGWCSARPKPSCGKVPIRRTSRTPLQNNLPLWPLKIGATNMQVTTTLPDGSQRIYQFALFAKAPDTDGQDDPDVTFGLIFTYPEVVKQEAVAAWKARRAAADAAAAKATAKARLAVDVFYGERNWAYIARPNKAWIANAWPKPEVSDNGQLTAFLFQGNVAEPAVYIVDAPACGPGGGERLAPFDDRNGMKIVQTTAQHFRLRLGDEVMEVCNQNWDSGVGQNPRDGDH